MRFNDTDVYKAIEAHGVAHGLPLGGDRQVVLGGGK